MISHSFKSLTSKQITNTILLENNRLMTIIFIERVSQIFTQTKGQPNFLGEDKGGLPHHF